MIVDFKKVYSHKEQTVCSCGDKFDDRWSLPAGYGLFGYVQGADGDSGHMVDCNQCRFSACWGKDGKLISILFNFDKTQAFVYDDSLLLVDGSQESHYDVIIVPEPTNIEELLITLQKAIILL